MKNALRLVLLGVVIPLLAAPLMASEKKTAPKEGAFEFHFQVVTPKPIKEQAGAEARAISYGKMGKQRTVIIHVRTTSQQGLTDWVSRMAPGSDKIVKNSYVGIWYVNKPNKGPLLSRVFFTNLRPVRAAETHKLADGSGEEYEVVFTYDVQKSAKGPIDKTHPLPL